MKKVDLHIHTVLTKSDHPFSFDLSKLEDYVTTQKIDAIGITNHNKFDIEQYHQIVERLSALVIPGIEINLEGGHLLLLADPSEVTDFSSRTFRVSEAIPDPSGSISINTLKEIFPDLSRYLLIPHYDKKPAIPSDVIGQLRDFIIAGEVSSPKKFVYCKKDPSALAPVFFSDTRFDANLNTYPIRQTFVDIGDVTFSALRYALKDKNKVYLTKHSGHSFFQANNQGLILSTGLNVILGERSSGKSYTLNTLEQNFERVKYIKQFSLVERSDSEDSERFNQVLRHKQSLFVQEFLKEFKACVDDVSSIDLENDERSIEQYLSAMFQNAQESEKADAFSKSTLFSETEFSEDSFESLKKVIEASMVLADNEEFRAIIEKYVSSSILRQLAVDLMEHYSMEKEFTLKKTWANDLIASVKAELQRRTAATPIPEIDLYSIAMNRGRIRKFSEVTALVRQERQIFIQDIQGFRIVAKTKPFTGAGELKNLSGKQLTFSKAFQEYGNSYSYLKQLRQIEGLPATDFHRFFAAIEYKILNRFNFEVSGGERSEFRLLQEISDALQYDMLLIDEPESSFDNLFLNSEVNQLIKNISSTMPVVVVTHNSTVGASIKPDYLVFTKRVVESGTVNYRVLFGHPSDKCLKDADGVSHPNHQILLNCLEAGVDAYNERGSTYETLKN